MIDFLFLLLFKIERFYSGCQKNVPVFKRFFLQPLMPQFRHSEHYYGKRYKITGFILASFFNKFRSNRTMKGLKLKNLVYLFCWKIKIS